MKPYTLEGVRSIQAEWETGALAGGMARSTIGRLIATALAGFEAQDTALREAAAIVNDAREEGDDLRQVRDRILARVGTEIRRQAHHSQEKP